MSVSAITDSMHTAMKIIALEGSAIVEKAANVMDGDAFENLVKTMDSEDPFYEEARLKLLYIKEGTNSRFLFTMTALSRNGLPIYY
jgi:methyl-accepting chemotaxis protein